MAEKRASKGQARFGDLHRRRAERERRDRITRLLPFGILGVIVVFVVGLGIFGALRSSGAFENPNGKSQFTVNTDKLELGDQKLGSTVRAQFNIKNTGDGTLRMNVPAMPTVLDGC